jgi:HK97 gp10 family phage protein
MQITMQEVGLDQLQRRLDALGDRQRYRVTMTKAHRAGIRVVERYVKENLSGSRTGAIYRYGNVEHQASAPGEAPAVETGNLKNSVRVLEANAERAVLGATAEYAAYLEFGTRHMAPRPYMRPAVDEHIGEIEEVMARVIDEALDGR